MKNLIQYGIIAAVIAGIYFYNKSGDHAYVEDDIDLNAVLDVTLDALVTYDDSLQGLENLDADQTFVDFAKTLENKYNAAQPPLYKGQIGVSPQKDASLVAYADTNNNHEFEKSEDAIFMIEIDGENARIVASSRSGAVSDHHFSGTSLLAGYLIGSMLGRQRMAGVDTKNLSSKKPVTTQAAAKARAGSGSHRVGK